MSSIDIAICTYKRKELVHTLNSISNQSCSLITKINLIIADNDDTPSAKEIVLDWAQGAPANIEVKYIHAPRRNISVARNSCLDNATSNYLIFIDDDEQASELWLEKMITKAISTGADVVFGPVIAQFPKGTPEWIMKIDMHSTTPVFVNGKIETGYTGNTLLKLNSEKIKHLKFDLTKGRTGGEDSDFLSRAFLNGASMVYEDKAFVFEPVSKERTSLDWLIKRRSRVGYTYAETLLNTSSNFFWRVKNLIMSILKSAFCISMYCLHFFLLHKRYFWILRFYFHISVFRGLLGYKAQEQY